MSQHDKKHDKPVFRSVIKELKNLFIKGQKESDKDVDKDYDKFLSKFKDLEDSLITAQLKAQFKLGALPIAIN